MSTNSSSKASRAPSKGKKSVLWKSYKASFKQPLHPEWRGLKMVVLDTETTGFDLRKDRILSIGALVLRDGEIAVKDSLELYVQQDHFDREAAKVHGILKETQNTCLEEDEALGLTLEYLQGAVLVAHHAAFDVNMLNNALYRNGFPPLKNKVIDTCALFYNTRKALERKEAKRHTTLDELADLFSIPKEDRHTALGDSWITARVLLRILTQAKISSTRELLRWGKFRWYR